MQEIGLIGLGRMGANMARRLSRAGLKLAVCNRTASVAHALAAEETNLRAVDSYAELLSSLPSPRIVWLMLPAGGATETALQELFGQLAPGDLLVDGANAYYQDSMRHAEDLAAKGVEFVDAGVSGGVWGLDNGYALMLGGAPQSVARLRPLIEALAPAPDKGWVHCGPAGSGHFAKMVHNGIEYGMMQALAEGLALMKSKQEFDFDLAEVSEAWRHGSVVRSWLLDLTAEVLKQDQDLEAIQPHVADSGEGRWTALEAINQKVPAPVMSLALMMRYASQGNNDYPAKLLAMMRNAFGGHKVEPAK
ncbi:decarboxylating 6-phosphogluconate dehydrogenase [Betaproteobacteria bacterium SCN2]|nr:decarboxylating 6-phosphogluconate dehydrogenase [Betaproteobacteria bacterium SCN2]